jgi:CDP-glucose 4,6-dehydratase
VLVTGHTGFKGAWLCLWLQALGARVCGVSLTEPVSSPSLYELARVGERMEDSIACDVRQADTLARAVGHARPEVVFHLAAQPLVRRSLREPGLTYEVNALGTANLLDAVLACPDVRAVVVVTSDKCYAPSPTGAPHREEDPLGGHDPYSSSKACAELIVEAYRRSYFAGAPVPRTEARLASARAGNVFGGGDFGEDRLLPDLFRAIHAGTLKGTSEPLLVRNPDAVRPWQHVLCPLSGYLVLAQGLLAGEGCDRAWNFGPAEQDALSVRELVELVSARWPGGVRWERDGETHPPEIPALRLDSGRARAQLGWEPCLSLQAGVELTTDWFGAHQRGEDLHAMTLAQIERVSGRLSTGVRSAAG